MSRVMVKIRRRERPHCILQVVYIHLQTEADEPHGPVYLADLLVAI